MLTHQQRKMADNMKEMAEFLLRHPNQDPSSEAAHVGLLFANVAWNESVGIDRARNSYRPAWETIETENPFLWNEFMSNDIDAMIDELVSYKKSHWPDDQRRILVCGMVPGKIHVEWLPPAAPGVDAKWELELYSLVRTSAWENAIRFLRKSRAMSHTEAVDRVAEIAAELDAKGAIPLNPDTRRK